MTSSNFKVFSETLFLFAFSFFCCCSVASDLSDGTKNDGVSIFLSSPNTDTVSRPLPLTISGKIKGFSIIPDRIRRSLSLYIFQKSKSEVIFHIQPQVSLSTTTGDFVGHAWLGSRTLGDGEIFELIFVLVNNKIPLREGDNPVENLPNPAYYKQSIFLRRDDQPAY